MMIKLRYFKGGRERREEALTILEKLIVFFNNDCDAKLRNVLLSYQKELQDNRTAIPIAISRLNVGIVKVISENKIHVSNENSKLLKALRDLAYFRLFGKLLDVVTKIVVRRRKVLNVSDNLNCKSHSEYSC